MKHTPKQQPKTSAQQEPPALADLFALLGQSDQGSLEQMLDHMRPSKGER